MSKIVVTVGPATISSSVLKDLIRAGADTFRINLSHANLSSFLDYFNILESIGIIPSLDTQGSQLRVKSFAKKSDFILGEELIIGFESSNFRNQNNNIPIVILNHFDAFYQIKIGDKIRIDFSGLVVSVSKISMDGYFLCEVISPGNVIENRAVDILGKSLELGFLTDFDKEAIDIGISRGCKSIYTSFTSSHKHVLSLKERIPKDIKIISKIETSRGLADIRKIAEISDEILVDRGDLSREISIPLVPIATARVISICKELNTPVNIATNVLDSMINDPLPSRAEISDIYNSLKSGVSGIVLAAEVAIGKNPVQSVALLRHLMNLYENHSAGLHGVCYLDKPHKDLIGEELLNWI